MLKGVVLIYLYTEGGHGTNYVSDQLTEGEQIDYFPDTSIKTWLLTKILLVQPDLRNSIDYNSLPVTIPA